MIHQDLNRDFNLNILKLRVCHIINLTSILSKTTCTVIIFYRRCHTCIRGFLLTFSQAKYTVKMIIKFNKFYTKLNIRIYLFVSCRPVNCFERAGFFVKMFALKVDILHLVVDVSYIRVPDVLSSGKVS